jgi:hypothetical protein
VRGFLFGFLIVLLTTAWSAAEPPAPTIMYSNLLNGVKLDHKTGRFRIDTMNALFLPKPVRESKMIYKYNPKDGGKLDAILRRGSTDVATFHFYGQERKAPTWTLNSNELDGGAAHDFNLKQPGDYSLEFQIEGKPFQRFDFSLSTIGSDDVYDPGEVYVLDGPWSDYGYLYYSDAVPSNNLSFKTWFRLPGKVEGRPSQKIKVELLDSAGAVVAGTRGSTSYYFSLEWKRYDFMLHNSKGAIRASDLLAKDGNYTVRVTVDGQKYGSYPYTVSGGKLLRQGRADRASTNPLDFVEGGRDAWFSKRQ